MRNSVLTPFVTDLVTKLFDADVAEAFISGDLFPAVIRKLNTVDGTESGITRILTGIAADLDDGTADWLVEYADSPSGWLYSRI